MGLPTSEKNTVTVGLQRAQRDFPAAKAALWAGNTVGIGQDDGMLKHLSGSVTPRGIFAGPSIDYTADTAYAAGGATAQVLYESAWLSNSTVNTVSGSHVGQLCFAETTTNTYTVGMSGVGFEIMGRVEKVDATKGVLVNFDLNTPVSASSITTVYTR